jgi:hypothetical protein
MPHRTIIAAGAISLGLLFAASPKPAQAYEYPWCGYMNLGRGGQQQSCTFSTLQQCRAFVSPNGYCDTNPRGRLARGRAPAAAYGFAYPHHRR